MLKKSAADLVQEAKEVVRSLTPSQANEKMLTGGAFLVDIREAEELVKDGKIAGSLHAPRGLLEFYADPESSTYKPEFGSKQTIILYCATGQRSTLAAATLRQMGYENIASLDGGIHNWKDSGLPVVQ